MKIALLLTGNLRSFDRHKDYYQKLVQKYNMDVFCFTDDNNFIIGNKTYLKQNVNNKIDLGSSWNILKTTNHEFLDHKDAKKLIVDILESSFNENLKSYFIMEYHPDFIPIEKDNVYHEYFFKNQSRSYENKKALINNSYKVFRGFELLETYEKLNSFEYDIIIKSRFDVLPYDLLNKDIFNFEYKDTLIVDYCSGYFFDHGAMGNHQVMKDYCSYYKFQSLNLVDNIHKYMHNFKFSDIPQPGFIDISDSNEFGLTYLIKEKLKYQIKNYDINFRHPIV